MMEEQKNTAESMKGKTCSIDGVCGMNMNMNMGSGCGCGMGCGRLRGHGFFRIVLLLIIVVGAFWLGEKVGEFKTVLRYGGFGDHYGYYMMDHGYSGAPDYGAPAAIPGGTTLPKGVAPVPTKTPTGI